MNIPADPLMKLVEKTLGRKVKVIITRSGMREEFFCDHVRIGHDFDYPDIMEVVLCSADESTMSMKRYNKFCSIQIEVA